MTAPTLTLEVDRSDHARTRILEEPEVALDGGEVRLAVERFALTSNNVTYAAVGDAIGYWDFFPAAPGWGRVPAMGWGRVVESRHPEVAVGGRYYGWFPMSTGVTLAVSATESGLRDEGAHRAAHAPVYRAFTLREHDPFRAEDADAEDRHALLRGLFLTGFLADDFLAEQGYFGASQAAVLSASSKTAIGFAQCAGARPGLEVVGLTSPGNVDFVAGVEGYDRALPYDRLENLAAEPAVVVDLGGDGALLARVHAHLGERLRYSMAIGLSHHDAPPRPETLAGPAPEFFFAPAQVAKRTQDWGPEGYRERVTAALASFVDESRAWLRVERSEGPKAAAECWQDVRNGRVPPQVGRIVSLWEAAGAA